MNEELLSKSAPVSTTRSVFGFAKVQLEVVSLAPLNQVYHFLHVGRLIVAGDKPEHYRVDSKLHNVVKAVSGHKVVGVACVH